QKQFIAFSAVGACLAEDGFDPSTSGLWAQHASAAPLCSSSLQSCCWLQGSHCRNISWKNIGSRHSAVWCLFNCKLDLTKKKRLRRSRQSKVGAWLSMKLATCCPLKTSCRTSNPGFRLRFVKGNYTGVALQEGLAEDGFDPSTTGLWAQHASAGPLCSSSLQSCCWLQGSHCRNISWKIMRARLSAVWCLFNCKLDLTQKDRKGD